MFQNRGQLPSASKASISLYAKDFDFAHNINKHPILFRVGKTVGMGAVRARGSGGYSVTGLSFVYRIPEHSHSMVSCRAGTYFV